MAGGIWRFLCDDGSTCGRKRLMREALQRWPSPWQIWRGTCRGAFFIQPTRWCAPPMSQSRVTRALFSGRPTGCFPRHCQMSAGNCHAGFRLSRGSRSKRSWIGSSLPACGSGPARSIRWQNRGLPADHGGLRLAGPARRSAGAAHPSASAAGGLLMAVASFPESRVGKPEPGCSARGAPEGREVFRYPRRDGGTYLRSLPVGEDAPSP